MSLDPSPSAKDPDLSGIGRALLGTRSNGGTPSSGPWVPPSADELAKLLPDYEIVKMLGRGGMGAVYMGRQKSLDRPVAIKILSTALEDADPSFAERFKNEARAMAKLMHPGIVAVFDFGETTCGLLYIVMEYVEGTDVARMIAKDGRLHTEHAMAITAHLCDALAYAHERGIIHRDIKPANIMVGYDGVVKVADFGLAKMTHSNTTGLTQSGMAMGTLHYMAPEALMLGSAVDHRADIYAAGVMLYQMLTGKIPQGMFKLPSLQVGGLDPRYDGIIAKAIMEDREARYQAIREMRHDLDGILTQPVAKVEAETPQVPAALPTMARPQRPSGQPGRLPSHQPQVVVRKERSWLPWAVVVLMAGLAAWLFVKQSKGPEAAVIAPSEPQPASPGLSGAENKAMADGSNAKSTGSVPQQKPAVAAPPNTSAVQPQKALPASAAQPAGRQQQAPPAAVTLPTGPTTWTDTKGRSITATFKAIASGNVLLDIAGKVTPVPFNTLSPESQKLARACHNQSNPAADDPAQATKDKPFVNSLGMSFVPVHGADVLFCIHEARHKDYAAYAAEARDVDDAWKDQTSNGYSITERGGDHPVINVSWENARTFCEWLGRKEGRTYRLPTDEEWSIAVGLGGAEKHAKGVTPAMLSSKESTQFPWGDQWPPPQDAGNYSDQSRKNKAPRGDATYFDDDDGHPTTSPVMSFRPGKTGLYDLGGNVWEWCEDWYDNSHNHRVLRGASWSTFERGKLLSSHRTYYMPGAPNNIGFRCVLESKPSATTPAALPPSLPAPSSSTTSATKEKPFVNPLGMKFVPVPGTKVLMCVHETRIRDYKVFAARRPEADTGWKARQANGAQIIQEPDHPVVLVSWQSAKQFCDWLASAGNLRYRLPTDREWSAAVGIAEMEDPAAQPSALSARLSPGYPWGAAWPPPAKFGNFADSSATYRRPVENISGYTDGFPYTAPVMSFAPNRLGIFDLSGNVCEACEGWMDDTQRQRIWRGSSYGEVEPVQLLSSFRLGRKPAYASNHSGFRVVIELP